MIRAPILAGLLAACGSHEASGPPAVAPTPPIASGGTQIGNADGPQVAPQHAPPRAGDDHPTGRITIAEKQALDESSLTTDDVLAKTFSAYVTGLHRCYEDVLKRDPTARGKIVLELTVSETGWVSGAKATGFDDGVSACFQARAEKWRFDNPTAAGGAAATAGFRLTFVLVPE